MKRLPECRHCRMSAHSPYLVCAVHPDGVEGDCCPDFEPAAVTQKRQKSTELSYYDNDLVLWQIENLPLTQRLNLLDWHPLFTGRCPQCGESLRQIEPPYTHWSCSECGWSSEPL